jgi:hypothetical protein
MQTLLSSVSVLCLIAARSFAQPALTTPRLGFIVDSQRALRPIDGIAGNFIVGEALSQGVEAAAFSGTFGLLKTSAAISVVDSQGRTLFVSAASAGPALFAFTPDGTPAFTYLPRAGSLLEWRANQFAAVPFRAGDVGGRIAALASITPGVATCVVERANGLWRVDLEAATGAVQSQQALPGVSAPVFLSTSGVLVYAGPNGLTVRRPSGLEIELGSPSAVLSMQSLGDGWIHAVEKGTGQRWAVRWIEGREQSYQLPDSACAGREVE